jgi:hypothetical protein
MPSASTRQRERRRDPRRSRDWDEESAWRAVLRDGDPAALAWLAKAAGPIDYDELGWGD